MRSVSCTRPTKHSFCRFTVHSWARVVVDDRDASHRSDGARPRKYSWKESQHRYSHVMRTPSNSVTQPAPVHRLADAALSVLGQHAGDMPSDAFGVQRSAEFAPYGPGEGMTTLECCT